MLGTGTALRGSMYQSFEPFDDAPVKGEFDWGGFFKNLLIGIAVTAVLAAVTVATAGAGAVVFGAMLGATIGTGMCTIFKAGEELSSGNVRSTGETLRDLTISAISGAISGAIGAKFPGMNKVVEGLVDTGVSAFERGAYALFDPSMSWEEKLAYTFDPKQMAFDFVSGIIIGEAVDWVASKVHIGKPKGDIGRGGFDLDGNEVPYLSDFFENADEGIDRLSGKNQFYSINNSNGGKVYVSTNSTYRSEFKDIVDNADGQVNILSGVHGDFDGSFLKFDEKLLAEDIEWWGNNPKVRIVDMSKISTDELSLILKSKDTNVCAWCISERSKEVLKA